MAHPKYKLPSQEELLERYRYDPETGELFHARKNAARIKIGDKVGKKMYIGNRGVAPASVIWKMMTGEDPPDIVDHEDGNCDNNRWTNLRLANHSQNAANRKYNPKTNKTGVKGVYLNNKKKRPNGKKYIAGIVVNRKKIQLGTTDCIEEAKALRLAGEMKYFGEYRTDRVCQLTTD